jgi:carboxylesterase
MRQIIPTAEPFFFTGKAARARIGCLVTHGFTGAPKEMRWLGEYLNRQGYTVCGIRLNGHATKPEDMIRSRYRDWLLSVEDGYNLLSTCTDQVFLLGLSMGGILSLTSASYLPVRGVVAISTPYEMPVKTPLPLGIIKAISLVKPFLKKSAAPDDGWFDKAAFAQHVSYPENPLRSGVELKLLIDAMHAALPSVKVPVLLIHSKNDDYVIQGGMQKLYDALGSKDKHMLWVENSGHVITEEPQREKVFKASADFIKRVSQLP